MEAPTHAHGHRAPGSWLPPAPFQSQRLVLAAQGRVYTGTSCRSGLLSAEATQAACIPQDRVPLVPLPPSRMHPCSSHQCKHHTRTAGFLRDTLAPEHWEGKQRLLWEQTGSPTRVRPMRRARRVPARPAFAPGSLLRAQGLPEGHAGTLSEQRGANASTVLHVPRKCRSENTVKPKS